MRLSVRHHPATPEPTGSGVGREPARPIGRFRMIWRSPIGLAIWTMLVLSAAWPLALAATPPVLAVPAAVLPLVALAEVVPVWLLRSFPAAAWYTSAVVAVALPSMYRVLDNDPWVWPPSLGITLLVTFRFVCARGNRFAVVGAWLTAPVIFWTHSQPDTRAGWTVCLVAIAMTSLALRILLDTRQQLWREKELTEAEKARRTVLEERARIARDLHDVVAHHMSMVVVQAETAPFRLAGLTPEASADFAAISQTAREALNEVRGLLGLLRSEDISTDLRPQPGLDDLDDLVATAVRAGADVGIAVFGTARPLRPGVEVGAYRIVQESLANAARHAPGAAVRVAVEYTPQAVELSIVNGPSAEASDQRGPAGHGLTGMTERAVTVGGTLDAGPTPDGGFSVRAWLPAPAEPLPLDAAPLRTPALEEHPA